MRRLAPCLLLAAALLFAPAPAAAQDLNFGYVPSPGPGEKPALLVTPARAVKSMHVEITAGSKTYTFDKGALPADKQVSFPWPRDPAVTEASAFIRAVFPDGFVDEYTVPINYSYTERLSVDLSKASADLKGQTVKVKVTAKVDTAEVISYGARKVILDQRSVEVGAGPGEITIPWVGDPGEVVLLDVNLHAGGAYAGFTFSPWFLDIPHDDVLFETNSAEIPGSEAYKMEATLTQLKDVLDKYGGIVPVKLYIAGCTDTAGDNAHNKELSNRRARSIAAWLRAHGYDKPIYYYGFGESLLSVQTGDGVDNAANRRVLYLVGANPPPPSSGIPQVGWQSL